MVIGAAMALARNIPLRVGKWLKHRFTVTVDVPSGSRSFYALQLFLDRHPYSRKARALTASDGEDEELGLPDGPSDLSALSAPPRLRVMFTPAPGSHILWIEGRPLWLQRERRETAGKDGEYPGFRETITLTLIGRSQEPARALFREAVAILERQDRKVRVWVNSWNEWVPVAKSGVRDIDSVVLPRGLVEDTLAEIDRFLGGREWYEARGIPWKMGMLFEGPPGTGKTSLIRAVAGRFGLDLYAVGIASRGMTDEHLMRLLSRIPPRAALLLEDLDRIVNHESVSGAEGGITLSGLFNALDGAAIKPGMITFATANHPERLDAALVRPGRFDIRLAFPLADADQAARLFQRFYEGADPAMAEAFGRSCEQRSPAEIQQLLMRNRSSAEDALREAWSSTPFGRPGRALSLTGRFEPQHLPTMETSDAAAQA